MTTGCVDSSKDTPVMCVLYVVAVVQLYSHQTFLHGYIKGKTKGSYSFLTSDRKSPGTAPSSSVAASLCFSDFCLLCDVDTWHIHVLQYLFQPFWFFGRLAWVQISKVYYILEMRSWERSKACQTQCTGCCSDSFSTMQQKLPILLSVVLKRIPI